MGFRRAEEMNKAIMEKLIWRLFTEAEKPWVRLLKAKYKADNLQDIQTTTNQNPSFIWRGICWSRGLVEQGLGRIVNNGSSTFFWTDRWVGMYSLQQVAVKPIPASWTLRMVADYWVEGVDWKWNELEGWLSHSTLLQLAALVVRRNSEDDDLIAWIPSTHKVFTVKSAYELAAGWNLFVEDRLWKHIWALKVQQRIKVFVWQMTHNKLLTNEARWKRGLDLTRECSNCVGCTETVLHSIRDCSDVVEVWSLLLPSHMLSKFFSLPLREWVQWNLEGKDMLRIHKDWPMRMAICCSWLWKWRNERIFKVSVLLTELKLEQLWRSFDEQSNWMSANHSDVGQVPPTR